MSMLNICGHHNSIAVVKMTMDHKPVVLHVGTAVIRISCSGHVNILCMTPPGFIFGLVFVYDNTVQLERLHQADIQPY